MRAIAAFGIGFAALCGMGQVKPAKAADLAAYPPPPAYAEPDPQFEFGTGWYLRGDAAFGPENQPRLSATGFGTKSNWDYGLSGGFGYKLNNYFRADVTGDYFQQLGFSTTRTTLTGTELDQGTLNRYAGLINGYFDLGNWSGFTPYVGAGIGIGGFGASGSVTTTNAAAGTHTFTRLNLPGRTDFAWAVMAGASYQLNTNASVDLGYRHIDLGRYGTTIGPFSFARSFTRDEVRLGLRYMIF